MTPSAAISAGGASISVSLTGAASVSAAAIIRSSSASCSCSISRSIFSEDWPKACFLSLAMRSRRAGGALSARRLDQLVMGAQGGGYLGVLCLQSRDHRLQKGGIIREILGIAGHATDYHTSGQNAIKTRVFRRINHPTRAGGAPQSGLRQSIPSHSIANWAEVRRTAPSPAFGHGKRPFWSTL